MYLLFQDFKASGPLAVALRAVRSHADAVIAHYEQLGQHADLSPLIDATLLRQRQRQPQLPRSSPLPGAHVVEMLDAPDANASDRAASILSQLPAPRL